MDYKDKIIKLLALSKSPNENEAKLALLKARELMAKYRIEEGEFSNDEISQKIVSRDIKEITYHSRRNPWMSPLLKTFDDYYCVTTFSTGCRGKATKHPTIAGFENDVYTCIKMIEYIFNSINSWATNYIINHHIKSARDKSIITNSFGYGFIEGWNSALKEQTTKNPEWGLILVSPDVSCVVSSEGFAKIRHDILEINPSVYSNGVSSGYAFGTQKRIE